MMNNTYKLYEAKTSMDHDQRLGSALDDLDPGSQTLSPLPIQNLGGRQGVPRYNDTFNERCPVQSSLESVLGVRFYLVERSYIRLKVFITELARFYKDGLL